MDADLIFIFAASLLVLHEMDAIDKKEWRLLFVLRRLPDDGALRWFIVLHLPFLVGLFVLVAAAESPSMVWVEGSFDMFLIAHAALHERAASRGDRPFANAFSRSLIWSSAGLGAIHLVYLLNNSA